MNRHGRRAAAAAARRGGPAGPTGEGPAAPGPIVSSASELHRQVLEAERALAGETLAKRRSPDAVNEIVDGAGALAEMFGRSNPTSASSLACKRGCNHCCHRPVSTSAPVVLRIAAALRERSSEAEFASVLARVVALDEKTHGLPFSPRSRPPLACAFLVDGACSIYDVRPLVCRAWNSADEDSCRQALKEEAVQMRFDLFQRTTFSGVEKGMQVALRAAGLDPVELEFTAAIRVAIEQPDACERWLAGEAVFAGCEAKHTADDRYRLPLA